MRIEKSGPAADNQLYLSWAKLGRQIPKKIEQDFRLIFLTAWRLPWLEGKTIKGAKK